MYCQNCGAKNTNSASYCFQCGTKLNGYEDKSNQLKISSNQTSHKANPGIISNIDMQKHRRNKNIAILLIIIVVIIVGVDIWYNDTHYNSRFQNNFLSSCESSGGNSSICGCGYNVLKNNNSYSEAKQMDAEASAGQTSSLLQQWEHQVNNQCG